MGPAFYEMANGGAIGIAAVGVGRLACIAPKLIIAE